jgi:hypothetical protein
MRSRDGVDFTKAATMQCGHPDGTCRLGDRI